MGLLVFFVAFFCFFVSLDLEGGFLLTYRVGSVLSLLTTSSGSPARKAPSVLITRGT